MKKVLIILMFLLLPSGVLARSKINCDFTLLSNLKKIASNVDVSYQYKLVDDNVYFDITIANITEDIYFVNKINDKKYYYSDTNNGVISFDNYVSGVYDFIFYSNNNECLDEKLNVRKVNLPHYNSFYQYEICIGIENYPACQKWGKYAYDFDSFMADVASYRRNLQVSVEESNQELSFFDKVINFLVNYYYIYIPLIIIIVVGIMYLIKYIKFKINRFDI